MRKFLLIGIILLVCISGILVNLVECSSSTGKISGVIKAYWPKIGFIPSIARIDVSDIGLFTLSSSKGNYIINHIPAGKHTIKIFKHGYSPIEKIISIAEGQKIKNVDFNLGDKETNEREFMGGVLYLGFNLDYEPLNNLKVRQALNHAIDKKTLVDKINSKYGFDFRIAQHPLPWTMFGTSSNIAGYPYSVDKAKELFLQAGQTEGFNIDLYYTKGNSKLVFIAKKIKAYLAKIGIKVDRKEKKWDQLLSMIGKGKVPFFLLGWIADTPDATDFLYSLYHSKGSANYSHYNNSILDNQIKQAQETIDNTNYLQLIQQIEETIVNDAAAIYLYYY